VAVIEVHLEQAFSKEALHRLKERIGRELKRQTLDRIRHGGDDEIKFAPLDFARPMGGKGSPLFATGRHLYRSIAYGLDSESVWVGSNFIGARVHQYGTVGKSSPGVGQGRLPSIVPVRAKALFIPLSRMGAGRTALRETPGGNKRFALRRRKGEDTDVGLKQGKDFLLLQKVDIRPRPFLRMSRQNVQDLVAIMGGK
jgi:phage gpG-like protein